MKLTKNIRQYIKIALSAGLLAFPSCSYLDVIPPAQPDFDDTMKDESATLGFLFTALGDSEGVKKVTLDDGSIVWLRGNSVLKIPQSFSAVNRTVSLQGEAFFDIAKNASPCKEKHSLTSQRMLIHYLSLLPIM